MKTRYLLVLSLLLFTVECFAADRKVRLSWRPVPGASKYHLVIKQISKFHSEKVLETDISTPNYSWITGLDGFFSYEVTAKGTDPKIKQKKIVKNIFIDGSINPEDETKTIYLCDKEVRFDWKQEEGDLRYLFRLYDFTDKKVAHQQVLIGNIYKIDTGELRPGHKYRRLAIAYDKWGNVSVNSSKLIQTKKCEDMADQESEIPRLVGTYADVSYKFKNNYASQELFSSELSSREKYSLISPGVYLHLHPFRSRFSYSLSGSYTSYEDVQYVGAKGASLNDFELGGRFYFFIPDLRFSVSGGVDLIDKGVYSSKTYEQEGTIIIDRHNLLFVMVGAKGSRILFDHVMDMSLDFGMVALGTYRKGEGGVDPETRYSGLRIIGGIDYWFTPIFATKLDFTYLSLSGPDSYTEYGVGVGGVLRIEL